MQNFNKKKRILLSNDLLNLKNIKRIIKRSSQKIHFLSFSKRKTKFAILNTLVKVLTRIMLFFTNMALRKQFLRESEHYKLQTGKKCYYKTLKSTLEGIN